MSKKAFPINRVNIDPPKPVRVAPNPPIALPEREPRNIWVMIGVPALIVALIGTIVMLYVSGVRSLATGFFPLMGIGAFSMLAFSGRFGRARKITWGELEKGRRRYLRDLDTNRDEIQTAVCAQREWQNAVHSDPPGLGAIIGGPRMWERGRGDVDFLEVRVGTGVQHAPDSVLSVTWPDISSDEELEPVTGQALRDFILEQRKIRDIAKVVNLRSAPGFSFVSEDLDRVRSLMRSVLCSLAVFHNPRDVKLMVVTRNPEVWAWMVWLPHNLHDELFDACGWRRLIFATPEELEAALGAELHMKGKRGAWTPPTVASPTAMGSALETGQVGVDLGPHLVIVDDNTGSPDAWESVVGQVGKAGLTVLRIASRVGTGVGFAEDQVFEMAQRHGAATAVKAGRDGADADDDQRPAPLLRARGTFFAHADQLSIHRAYRYARAMARWSPTSRSEVTDSTSGAAELLRSLGISDPRELDVDRLWAERRGRGDDRWCEIPVGAKPNGELQNIILRAKDFGGFGFHSVVIGTSGSGKSELFLSLVYGIALTHSPETFNVIFVDMKFESAAQDILGIPHVVAALSNLGKDERHLAERMRRVIDGEIKQRYELFKSVGARDANDYEEIRLAGRDLPPVPVLLVIVDEYLELFANHKKWIDLIIHIGQEGRGANVFFMLGGQRLDLSSLQKGRGPEYGVHLMCSAGGWIHGQRQSLLQNVTARIQLRLADPGESQMGHLSIESREAARRTLNRPGFGLTESLHELRIGVPALADPGTGELVGITDVGARIADVAGVTKHASLQRLPQRVELSAIVEHEAVHQGGDDLSIAFAIGERHELGPVPIKLRESPGLMILGRQGCGKTTALVAIGEAVMNRFSPQQAQLTLIDPKTAPHGLRDLHAPGYVRAYAYDQDEIDEVITELAQQILLPRLPPKGLSQEELRALKPWEGPRHFVLIDDVQDLRPAQSYPQKPPVGAALWKLMERARQVGLHVFSTRNSANWATMPMDPWVKSQTSAKVAQLYMDNDPQNRINRSVRAQTLPPGRGLLVGADGDVEGILVGYPSVPGEQ